jgi:hypothetical protein
VVFDVSLASDGAYLSDRNGTFDAIFDTESHLMNTAGFIQRLRDWHGKIGVYQELLSREGRRLRWRHYRFGLLAILLPLTAGSTIFLSIASHADARAQIASVAGLLVSAALTGMMTFYSHARRSEHSRFVAAQLGAIRKEIDSLIESPPETEPLMQQALWRLNDRITAASEGAPPVPFQVREAFICYDEAPSWLEQVRGDQSKVTPAG